ncbi:hypothetical protein CXB51_013278 [Gossypium anomalum]|uniref:Uncharacterized protein n=1 Tax=Gossypium anomalum TaxID=47600 RepID=A0A8J6D470_9ROSI|nr:hypothetical protein CXB51_013278 [Gossypium anomalum]
MSLIIAPMTDLSCSCDWHFLMTERESPLTTTERRSNDIPNFTACSPA